MPDAYMDLIDFQNFEGWMLKVLILTSNICILNNLIFVRLNEII